MKSAPKKQGGALSFRARQSGARAVLSRLMIACVVLLPLVATARGFLGTGGGRLLYETSRAANFTFYLSSTNLQARPAGWLETFFALPILFVETLRHLADFGWRAPLLHLAVAALLLGAIWFGSATFFGRRAPFLPLLLLLALQLGATALMLMRFFAPPISLSTPYTIFALARGENPSAEIGRLEKQGVRAALLAGNRALSTQQLSALQKLHPRVLIANGFAARSDDGARFVAVGNASARAKWRDANAAARDIANRGGAIIFEIDGLRDDLPAPPALLAFRDFRTYSSVEGALRKNAVVAGTTSGAAWTLLPRGLRDGRNVVRALRLGKAQALFARDVAAPSGVLALWQAAKIAWRFASRAQRIATTFSLVALFCALWLWSANGAARKEAALSGPQRAVGYLRKRRFIVRGGGALALLLAVSASALVAVSALDFALAIACWLVLDALFFYGYRLWRYTP